MPNTRLLLLLALVALGAARTFRSEEAEEEPTADATYGDEQQGLFEEPFWAEFAGKIQHSVEGNTLLRARRWGNIANGVLLGTTGPIALIISAVGLRMPLALLAGYLTVLGGTIAALELDFAPVAPWVTENLSFLATQPGRTALLGVAGGLAWAFGRPAALAAILTCANAGFNLYFDTILRFVSANEDGAFDDGAEPVGGEPGYAYTEPPAHGAEEQEYVQQSDEREL